MRAIGRAAAELREALDGRGSVVLPFVPPAAEDGAGGDSPAPDGPAIGCAADARHGPSGAPDAPPAAGVRPRARPGAWTGFGVARLRAGAAAEIGRLRARVADLEHDRRRLEAAVEAARADGARAERGWRARTMNGRLLSIWRGW